MANVWVIDGQSIYCQDGLPHRCRVVVDFDCPTWQAIDRHTASSLGVDVSQGEFVAYRALVGTVNAQLATELCHAIELSYWHKNPPILYLLWYCHTPPNHPQDLSKLPPSQLPKYLALRDYGGNSLLP